MKKLRYEAPGENEMRETMARVLPELRDNFRKLSLQEVKRNLVCRWVESLGIFGELEAARVVRSVQDENDIDF
jgi:hypothetical protein